MIARVNRDTGKVVVWEDWLLNDVRTSITRVRGTIIAGILDLDWDRGILEKLGGRGVTGRVGQVRELILWLIQVLRLEILLRLITWLRLIIWLRLKIWLIENFLRY